MWAHLSVFILNNRKSILPFFTILTLFAAYEASHVKLAFNPGKILPSTDSTSMEYLNFKEKFGEDGSMMVLGVKSNKLYEKEFFNRWGELTRGIQQLKGVKQVLSIANLPVLAKDTLQKRFDFKPLVQLPLKDQAQMDSLKHALFKLPFYEDVLFNEEDATIMAITFEDTTLQTAEKIKVIHQVHDQAEIFAKSQHTLIHYSGLPYIKTVLSALVAKEFSLFLGLSVLIAAIILWFFFRSLFLVFLPILFVLIGVTWSIGLMSLLGNEITILTGIIPPLIVIIGVPNSILIINRYRTELKTNDKITAIGVTIQKISLTTFIANLTTAIGFGVLYFTESDVLKDFGMTAAAGVMFTWFICLFLLPLALMALPKQENFTNGDFETVQRLLNWMKHLVTYKRKFVYLTVLALMVFSGLGISLIHINGFVVDDLPKNDPIYRDLKFFESEFSGVLPLEVSVHVAKKNGILNLSNIRKIDKLELLLQKYPEFGNAISINSALKYSSQVFYNGNPAFYRIPNEMEKNFMLLYAANSGKGNNMLKNFLDTDRQTTRISFQMKDVGSKKMNQLLADLRPRIDSVFSPSRYEVRLTGPVVMYVKGTNYLVESLRNSLLLAIFLIAIVMWILFRGFEMIILSLIPNLIPLMITAGVMGFCGIALKPSTILIYSIALGIASDQTIYFLTRYQQELKSGVAVSNAISKTMDETGVSMIYTAIILFFGFGIFSFSTFGGTVALGTLLSLTLVMAMFFNLTFLPALLLSFHKKK